MSEAECLDECLDESISRHPAGSQLPVEEVLLLNLQQRRRTLVTAKESYEVAMVAALEAEIPKSTIAHRLGLTEAAIRMFVQRKMRR